MFNAYNYHTDNDTDTIFDSDYMDVEKKDTPLVMFFIYD
jgi:hypothetical protein